MITLDQNELHIKGAIASPAIRPVFAMMNPENTYTLPKFQIACGAADIMMHTIDRYFTRVEGSELTDATAEDVICVAARNGIRALESEQNYDAPSELMWCGSLSRNGLTNLGRPVDFSVHQLGNSFSGIYPCATHGAVMAILWPVCLHRAGAYTWQSWSASSRPCRRRRRASSTASKAKRAYCGGR